MLNCRELTELMTDYLERKMSFRERIAFRFHLGMCGHCRAYLRQMKLTMSLLGDHPPEPMPAEVRDELMARFRTWKRRT
ncbi:MAG: zf-HC2 domain-containing protein [Kofleriaceae bacterium]